MIGKLRTLLVIYAILALSVFALNGCGGGGGGATADIPNVTSGTVTADDGSGPAVTQEISDESATDKDFDYNTTTNVELALTILDMDTEQAIPQTVITVYDEKGDVITSGTTNSSGYALLNVASEIANGSVTVVFKHDNYGEYKIVVDNIKKLASIDRKIKMKKKKTEPVKPLDTDGDGVADADDEFPNDAALAKKVKGEYTLVFEDLYPNKGDADFNDAVVKMTITEYINAQNQVAKINITAQAIASGAGYNNQFGINVLGKEYMLISNFKNDLNNKWNAKKNEKKAAPGPVHSQDIVLDTPADRNQLAPMPYDPFLVPNGVNIGRKNGEVHLTFVKSSFKGKVKDTDGFPWALVVPGNWAWPYENVDIRKAYPTFKTWYESNGKEATDWYLNPDVSQVYPYYDEASSLTAYLIGTRTGNRVLVIIALIAVGTVIGGLYFWNRKRYNATGR